MAKKLTGMEIFKLLPKTNCGECGVPTCMAFAMKLAQKNAELSACPYVSDEAKSVIGAASEPPIRLVKFGRGDHTVEMGNELVMFRHEKTFVHQTALAVQIDSGNALDQVEKKARAVDGYLIERAGEKLSIEALLINDTSTQSDGFRKAVLTAVQSFKGAIIIKSGDPKRLMQAAESVLDRVPLLHAVTEQNIQELGAFAISKKLPVVIAAPDLDTAFSLSESLTQKGHRDIVLDIATPEILSLLQTNTIARKAALTASVKPLGYPLMNFATGRTDAAGMIADASTALCKYASLLVIDRCEPESLLPVLMLRQNIYTDPQKPIQVEPKIYHVGDTTPSSPILVTTNFSLTYFIVSGEVEGSGVPAYLAVVDAEGMSVLTAWAAGKFSAEKISSFIKGQEVVSTLTKKRVVLPGYVSCLSGELEEKMPGWEIMVGPQEASDIGAFMKRLAP
jgi:acetyl-CoA decarbonylase/synthase, CODH/ACS complex subunit gamma